MSKKNRLVRVKKTEREQKTQTHTHLKSTLKEKIKICINALGFFDLVLPIFLLSFWFVFILGEFFLEFWKIIKVTPKAREQRAIYNIHQTNFFSSE